jgi:hypothetical protein
MIIQNYNIYLITIIKYFVIIILFINNKFNLIQLLIYVDGVLKFLLLRHRFCYKEKRCIMDFMILLLFHMFAAWALGATMRLSSLLMSVLITIHVLLTRTPWQYIFCILSSVFYIMDWNEPWQEYPLPNLIGITIGFSIEQFFLSKDNLVV